MCGSCPSIGCAPSTRTMVPIPTGESSAVQKWDSWGVLGRRSVATTRPSATRSTCSSDCDVPLADIGNHQLSWSRRRRQGTATAHAIRYSPSERCGGGALCATFAVPAVFGWRGTKQPTALTNEVTLVRVAGSGRDRGKRLIGTAELFGSPRGPGGTNVTADGGS